MATGAVPAPAVAGRDGRGRGRVCGARPGRDRVPQGLGLLEELSIRENVQLPGRLGGTVDVDVDELLAELGLSDVADRHPSESSLGEQQRAAVARAVAVAPALVLADEPTSHPDEA